MSNIHGLYSAKKKETSNSKKNSYSGIASLNQKNENDEVNKNECGDDCQHDHENEYDEHNDFNEYNDDGNDNENQNEDENDPTFWENFEEKQNEILQKLKEDPEFLKALMEYRQQKLEEQENLDNVVYIYKNGFKIGNDPFQSDTNPENKGFLAEFKAGRIPKKLEPVLREKLGLEATSNGVHVVDKQNENYIEEKNKFEAFQGTGYSLLNENNNNAVNVSLEFAESKELIFNDKEESSKIQVILANGKRETLTVNLNRTILELYGHIRHISNYDGKFQLLAGYPPQILDNPTQTLQEAQLQGARITQKSSK